MNRMVFPCHTGNYGGLRQKEIRYIVIHYTAGDGDTAENNGAYFSQNVVGASAHWFVDDTTAVLSVPEEFVAWHCGGDMYNHPDCRNANSIGVELCSRRDADGLYYFTDATEENAAKLVRELMKKYNVPAENVIRHYDVTGKICPAPYVGAGQGEWKNFKEMIAMVKYDNVEELPIWAAPTVQKLMENGFLKGTDSGLDLSQDMVRLLVILDRAGVFNA